ncbi:MAG TPA: hypothetical protein DCO86_04370 [Spirochaetaceae bacterium]|nr:hypothetical protein [Spirochaetaceae bacterium]
MRKCIILALLLPSFVFSCKSNAKVAVVSIDPPQRTVLYLGGDVFNSIQLSATIDSPDGNDKPLVWSAQNPDIVEVNQVTGVAKAKKLGKTIVSVNFASAGNMSPINMPDPFSAVRLNAKSDDIPANSILLTVAARLSTRSSETAGSSSGSGEGENASSSGADGGSSSSDSEVVLNIAEYIPDKEKKDAAASDYKWSFEPAGVLEIDDTGAIRVVDPEYVGTVNVVGEPRAFADETAIDFDIEVGRLAEKIEMNVSQMKLAVGGEAELIASVLPADSTRKSVKWFSSDSDSVAVAPKGPGAESQRATIKALKFPEADKTNQVVITAICDDGGYVATSTVTVSDQPETVNVRSVEIRLFDDVSADLSDGLWLAAGETCRLLPVITPSNATDKSYALTMDNDLESGYADDSISLKDDVVTALAVGKKGRVKVVCTDGGVSAYLDVHVISDALLIEDSKSEVDPIISGESQKIKINVKTKDNEPVGFESSSDWVEVGADGTASIKDIESHLGEYVDVTIKYNDGTSQVITIVIGDEIIADSIRIDNDVFIYETLEKKLDYDLKPANTTFKDVEWSSSNESVAAVDEFGNVTALSEGEAEITVRSVRTPEVFSKYKVTVRRPKVEFKTFANGSWGVYKSDAVAVNSNLKACADPVDDPPDVRYDGRNWRFTEWVLPQSADPEALNPSDMTGSAPAPSAQVVQDVVLFASYVRIPIVDYKVYDSGWRKVEGASGEVEPASNLASLVSEVADPSETEYDAKIWNFSKWVLPSSGNPEGLNPSDLSGSVPKGEVNGDLVIYASYDLAPASFKYMYWKNGKWDVFHAGGEYSGDAITTPSGDPQDVEYDNVIYTFNSWSVPSSEPADPSSEWTGSAVPSKTKRNVNIYAKYDRKPISVKYVYWKNSTEKWRQYGDVKSKRSGDDFDVLIPGAAQENGVLKIVHDDYTYKFSKWVIPNSATQYAASTKPSAEGCSWTAMPAKLKDNVTVYAYYSPSANVDFKVWDVEQLKWVTYETGTMLFDDTELPYPTTTPSEIEYSGGSNSEKRYVFDEWVYFSDKSDVRNYNPNNNTAGKIAEADDILNDDEVYARYKLKDIRITYMYFSSSNGNWAAYSSKRNLKSGEAFNGPAGTIESIVQDGKTHIAKGWTTEDQTGVLKLKNMNYDSFESSGKLLIAGETAILDDVTVYAVYRPATYPTLVKIPGVDNYKLTMTYGTGSTKEYSVSLDRFYVSDHEVTQGEWKKLYNKNEDKLRVLTSEVVNSNESVDDLPVVGVTWLDAVNFCNTMSKLDGLDPCYTQKTKELNGDEKKYIDCDFTKNGYRLLTETEWAYAATGGESYTHSGSSDYSKVGWFSENSVSENSVSENSVSENSDDENSDDENSVKTGRHAVKLKLPNKFGLYDMSGNVAEYCWDWFKSDYGGNGERNYAGPDFDAKSGSRIFRGGSFKQSGATYPSLTERESKADNYIAEWRGFRIGRSYL